MSNTPILSDYDEARAPWNDALPHYVHKDYTLAYEMHKTFECVREEDDDDYEGVVDDVRQSHYSPIELLDCFRTLLQGIVRKNPNLEKYKQMLKECEGWTLASTEIL